MERLTLLAAARSAGLAVFADGDCLVVRGPRAAEGLARELIARKGEILALLDPASIPRSEGRLPRIHQRGSAVTSPQGKPEFSRSRVSALVPVTPPDERWMADEPSVAGRVAAMRQRHAPPWRAVPTLTAREVARGTGGCLSCGEPIAASGDGLAVRCQPCVLAVRVVLLEVTKEREADG